MGITSDDADVYVDQIVDFFHPLISAAADPGAASRLLVDLGYVAPSDVTAFATLSPILDSLQDLIAALEDAAQTGDEDKLAEALLDVLRIAVQVFQAVNTFSNALRDNFSGSDLLQDTDILTAIARKLADYLVSRFLEDGYPVVHASLLAMGIIELEEISDTPTDSHARYLKRTVNWERIPEIFSDFVGSLKTSLTDAQGLRYRPLVYFLYRLCLGLGFDSTFVRPDLGALTTFNDGQDLSGLIPAPATGPMADAEAITPFTDISPLASLYFPLTTDPAVQLGILVYPVLDPATHNCTGVGAGLRFGSQLQIPLGDTWQITVKFNSTLTDSLGVRLDQNGLFHFITNLFTGSPQALADAAQFSARVGIAPVGDPAATPLLSIGTPDGCTLQIGSGNLVFGVDKSDTLNLLVEADLKDGVLVLKAGDADGFLASLLPADGIKASFDFGLGFSNRAGFYFKGSSGLQIQLPLHEELGPVSLDNLTLGLAFDQGKFPLTIASSISANLGPLEAAVDQVGVQAIFELKSDRSGNFGPLEISFAFKPPNGVGLAIDAGVVQGGGYLYIDTARGEYAGALELVVADWLTLTAIGLISTQMPDGSKGFSLLVIITADFGTGIQLGFGFTLVGVGGLLGLNRTMLFQPLMDGVRTGAINGILFPTDIIANAPKIISDLKAIFPPKEGTFLIGPMAKAGWGSPPLITLSLGVIIEIPPGDIAILGVLSLAIPQDDPVLILQVNFAGALEFSKQRLYFFASLFDSHILTITIDGEIAALFAYGADSNLVLSVGGFHPQFNPPPLPTPIPKRIELDIINEQYARIRCGGYFAATTNTLQFGAFADLYFGFSAVSVTGNMTFDLLMQWSPLHLITEVTTTFSAQVFGVGVFSLDIDVSLEGPTPWHIHGHGSISLLFFSVSVPIDKTFGNAQPTALPPIAVLPLIGSELGKQANWRAALPDGSRLLVTLRQLDPAEAALVLHPVGALQVSQRAVPLDLTIDKVGAQKPSDANYFKVDVTSTGLVKTNDLFEPFAPAQFKDYDDATKLSQPAYSPQHSGVEASVAQGALASGTAIGRQMRYALTIVDTNYRRFAERFYQLISPLFVHFLGGGSVTLNALSAASSQLLRPSVEKITAGEESYAIASQSNNRAYGASPMTFNSRVAAQDYLDRTVRGNATLAGKLHVLPQFEVTP
jgi:hypothetical protein